MPATRVKVRWKRERAIIEAPQTLNLPIQLTRHTRSRDITLFTCSSIKRNLPVLGARRNIHASLLRSSLADLSTHPVYFDNTHYTHTHTYTHASSCSHRSFCTCTMTIDIIAFTASWNLYRFSPGDSSLSRHLWLSVRYFCPGALCGQRACGQKPWRWISTDFFAIADGHKAPSEFDHLRLEFVSIGTRSANPTVSVKKKSFTTDFCYISLFIRGY